MVAAAPGQDSATHVRHIGATPRIARSPSAAPPLLLGSIPLAHGTSALVGASPLVARA